MDRLQQMEHLVCMAKKMANHNVGLVIGGEKETEDHLLISRNHAIEFLRRAREFQINFYQLEEQCNYLNQQSVIL